MWQTVFREARGRLRSGWRFFLAAIAFILVQFFASSMARLVVPSSHNLLVFESIFRPLALAMLLGIFGLMVKGADLSEEGFLQGQGLGLHRTWLRELMGGIGLGAAMIGAAFAIICLVGEYHATRIAPTNVTSLVLVLWITATAATMEEVAFRGYPFQKLVEGVGSWGAIAILSALFGAIHLGNPHASPIGFLNTVLVGIQLSVAYLRTRSLWLPIGIHFAWNASLGTAFGLPVSGVDFFAVVTKGNASGPEWLTGGPYGIEASLTGSLVILLGIVGVCLATQKMTMQRNSPATLGL